MFDVFIGFVNVEKSIETTENSLEDNGFITKIGTLAAKFDLEISHEERNGMLSCQLIFNTDVYDLKTIEYPKYVQNTI